MVSNRRPLPCSGHDRQRNDSGATYRSLPSGDSGLTVQALPSSNKSVLSGTGINHSELPATTLSATEAPRVWPACRNCFHSRSPGDSAVSDRISSLINFLRHGLVPDCIALHRFSACVTFVTQMTQLSADWLTLSHLQRPGQGPGFRP